MADVSKTLTHSTPPSGCINLYNDDGRLIAGMIGPQESSQQLAEEITARYNAPLIVLGRSHTLSPLLGHYQWVVLYKGERTLMTETEIRGRIQYLIFAD